MIIASRWLPDAAIVMIAGSLIWFTRRHAPPPAEPELPSLSQLSELLSRALPAPPPVASPPALPPVPTRAMPCTDTRSVTLRAHAGAPVLCGDGGCLELDLDQHAATLVDRVDLSPALPLHADVK